MDANLALGFSADGRSYDCVFEILNHLDVRSVQLLTHNPDKILAIENLGIDVSGRIPIEPKIKSESANYMRTKMERMGQILSPKVEAPKIEAVCNRYVLLNYFRVNYLRWPFYIELGCGPC